MPEVFSQPRIEVEVSYTFRGKVFVEGARDKVEAEEIVGRDFGCSLGILHTTNREKIVDWKIGIQFDQALIKAV